MGSYFRIKNTECVCLKEIEKDSFNTCHFGPADWALGCTIFNLKPTLVTAVAVIAGLQNSKPLNVFKANAASKPGRGSCRSWGCWLLQLLKKVCNAIVSTPFSQHFSGIAISIF